MGRYSIRQTGAALLIFSGAFQSSLKSTFSEGSCKIFVGKIKGETLIRGNQKTHDTGLKFMQLVKDGHLCQAMSQRKSCWDNAPQESFFGHTKDQN